MIEMTALKPTKCWNCLHFHKHFVLQPEKHKSVQPTNIQTLLKI